MRNLAQPVVLEGQISVRALKVRDFPEWKKALSKYASISQKNVPPLTRKHFLNSLQISHCLEMQNHFYCYGIFDDKKFVGMANFRYSQRAQLSVAMFSKNCMLTYKRSLTKTCLQFFSDKFCVQKIHKSNTLFIF